MMRGRRSAAVALRAPAGNILVHEEALNAGLYKSPIVQWPFVRGIVLLWDMLVLGTRMMMFAANVSIQTDEDGAAEGARPVRRRGPRCAMRSSRRQHRRRRRLAGSGWR